MGITRKTFQLDNRLQFTLSPSLVFYRFRESLHVIIVFASVLAVYIWSMPRTVVLEDDGLFILSSWFNGISHPPGYPLYTVLGHLATLVPIGNPAIRVHLLSAVFGALSCVCLFRIARRLFPTKVYAYTATLGMACSTTFWSQAIIAEVYTLNVFIFLLLFLIALKAGEKSNTIPTPGPLYLMAFLYGLGISNHWPLLVLSTPALLVLLWPVRSSVIRHFSVCLLFLLLGLTPYLWMVIRSQMHPEISFYGPISSWHDFWFYISRKGYADADVNVGAGWWDKWHYCWYVLKQTTSQFGSINGVFVWLGFFSQWRLWPWRLCCALVLGYLGSTFVLILLLGFNYEPWHQAIFRVYPLISYVIASLWLAAGIFVLIKLVRNILQDTKMSRVIPVGLCSIVVAIALMDNSAFNYRAHDRWAEDYARTLLSMVKPNAILFVSEDPNVGPLGYVTKILHVRPDVTLYHSKGFVFSNRLYVPFKTNIDSVRKSIDNLIANSGRPVYFDDMLVQRHGATDYGIIKQVIKNAQANTVIYGLSPVFAAYVDHILHSPAPIDRWESMHRSSILEQACRIATGILLYTDTPGAQKELVSRWSKPVCDNFMGKLLVADMLSLSDRPDTERISRLVHEAEALKDDALTKKQLSRLENLQRKLKQ